jgi:hypothetical protein
MVTVAQPARDCAEVVEQQARRLTGTTIAAALERPWLGTATSLRP